MYNVIFYEDKRGRSEIKEYLKNMKKTQKTPKSEIEKAKRYLRDYINRREEYEKQTF